MERREAERTELEEKIERKKRAEKKSKEAKEDWNRKQTQMKITEAMKILPKEKQILIENEEEKRNRILLKEAKEELWKRWRQRKGREKDSDKRVMLGEEDKRLDRIEAAIRKHKAEQEELKRREEETKERKKRQAAKKKSWEMLRWIVTYIEEKRPDWERRRKEEISRRRAAQKLEEDRLRNWKVVEGSNEVISPEEAKKRRLEVARMRTSKWRSWREEED